MTETSRVLHGVRLLGFAAVAEIAARANLSAAATSEELLDQQALGRVTWSEFADRGGWSLTEPGRLENERLLREQLDAVPDAGTTISRLYADFLPLNTRLQQACTDWQLRPTPTEPLAANDHTDRAWDDDVLVRLGDVAADLERIEGSLARVLPRLGGYHSRFADALTAGRIDEPSDSCHRIWFELHEDLIATLGLTR